MSTEKIGSNEISAGRWAKSLVELVIEEKLDKEIILQQFIDVVDTVKSSNDLKELFVNPIVTVEEKQKVIEKIFSGNISPILKNFLLVMALRKRLELLEDILEAYKKELNKHENIVRLTVTSAIEIDDTKRDNLKNKIIEKLSKNADICWKVDKTIIGGLVFNIDGTIVDDSLNTKLNNLCKRIIAK